MKIDTTLIGDLAQAGTSAASLEALGYDGAYTFEGPHDPFFPLVEPPYNGGSFFGMDQKGRRYRCAKHPTNLPSVPGCFRQRCLTPF